MNIQMIGAALNVEAKAGAVAAPRKRREIEAAWRQHDPWQGRVPFEVKGRLAACKRALTAAAERIEGHLSPHHRLLAACIKRRGLSRQRAVAALRMALPGAAVTGSRDCIEVRWLNGRDHLIVDTTDPSELQDAVCVHIALLWREPNGTVTFHLNYLLEVPDHAAARFLQRAPAADLQAALFEAARNFSAADRADVWFALVNRLTIYLAAGPGAFAADVISGKIEDSGKRLVFARARTWLADAMLERKQTPLKPAGAADCTVAAMLLAFAREATPSAAPALRPNGPPRPGVGADDALPRSLALASERGAAAPGLASGTAGGRPNVLGPGAAPAGSRDRPRGHSPPGWPRAGAAAAAGGLFWRGSRLGRVLGRTKRGGGRQALGLG
jgi:hypothetical protein